MDLDVAAIPIDSSERAAWLDAHRGRLSTAVLDRLKAEAEERQHLDPKGGLEIAEAAMEVARRIGTPLALGKAEWIRGNALFYLERHEEALESFTRAAERLKSAGAWEEMARMQVGQVFSLAYLGRVEEALSLAKQVRGRLEAMGDRRRLALLLLNVGVAHDVADRPGEALKAYDEARGIFDDLGLDFDAARADVDRALALLNLDRLEEAETAYLSALDVFIRHGQELEVARVSLNLGLLYARSGRFAAALDYFAEARLRFRYLDVPLQLAETDLYSAMAYLDVNLFDEALRLAQQATEALMDAGQWREAALGWRTRAAASRGLGDRKSARKALREAVRLLRKLQLPVQMAFARLEQASLWLESGEPSRALRRALEARREFLRIPLPLAAAQADVVAGRAALALGEREEAARYYRRALDVLESAPVLHLRVMALYGLGRIAEAKGEWSEARQRYDGALEIVRNTRWRLPSEELRLSYQEDKENLFADRVLLALRQGDPNLALEVGELARGDTLPPGVSSSRPDEGESGALRRSLAVLESRWNRYLDRLDGRYTAQDASAPTREDLVAVEREISSLWREISRVQAGSGKGKASAGLEETWGKVAGLEEGTGLLCYLTARGRIFAFILDRDGLRYWQEMGDVAVVRRHMDALKGNLQISLSVPASSRIHSYLGQTMEAQLRELFEVLILPLGERLAPYRRLVVVPDGMLHQVPFHLLCDVGGCGEAVGVGVLPSLRMLRSGIGSCSWRKPYVLAWDRGGELPQAIAEAEAVASVVPGSRLWVGEEATLERFRAAALDADLLHLASHARFRADNPFFSYIELADGRLPLYALPEMRTGARLVVMSACETGAGLVRGNVMVSLSRGWLRAGAHGLVVSMWKVVDAPTAELMREFYRRLSDGTAPIEALHLAQREMKEAGEPITHWGAWTYVGV